MFVGFLSVLFSVASRLSAFFCFFVVPFSFFFLTTAFSIYLGRSGCPLLSFVSSLLLFACVLYPALSFPSPHFTLYSPLLCTLPPLWIRPPLSRTCSILRYTCPHYTCPPGSSPWLRSAGLFNISLLLTVAGFSIPVSRQQPFLHRCPLFSAPALTVLAPLIFFCSPCLPSPVPRPLPILLSAPQPAEGAHERKLTKWVSL